MPKSFVAVLAASAWLALPTPASACGCSPLPGYVVANAVRDALGWADHVFIGQAARRDRGTVTLTVEEWWKGGEFPELSIVSGATSDPATEVVSDCDFSFVVGRRYVVFAQRSKPGLTVSTCSPSAELSLSSAIATELDRYATRQRRAGPQPIWLPRDTGAAATMRSISRPAVLMAALLTTGVGATPPRLAPLLPAFSDYPALHRFSGLPASPLLDSAPYGRAFRTRLRSGAQRGPNFAGAFTVVTWGCGSSCQETVVVDARSGRLSRQVLRTANGVEFESSSRLLIADPPRPGDPPTCVACGTAAAYEWTGATFTPVGPGAHPHLQTAGPQLASRPRAEMSW